MAREMVGPANSSRSSSTRRSANACGATRRGSTPRRDGGEIKNFTGIDSPYEAPTDPDVQLETAKFGPEELAERVVRAVLDRESRT